MLPSRHLFYLAVYLPFETNHAESQYTFHFLSRDLRDVCVMPVHFRGSAEVVVIDPYILSWDSTTLNIFVPVKSGSFVGNSSKSVATFSKAAACITIHERQGGDSTNMQEHATTSTIWSLEGHISLTKDNLHSLKMCYTPHAVDISIDFSKI